MASHVFVRAATALDATAIGTIHAHTMTASLTAAAGGSLDRSVVARIDADAFARQWKATIADPAHRVLVAVDDGAIAGFVSLSPTRSAGRGGGAGHGDGGADREDGGAGHGGEPGTAVADSAMAGAAQGAVHHERLEMTALEVLGSHQRRGHGSRLLAAAIDTCRELGAAHVQTWVLDGDDARAAFLASAGFGPAGLRRQLEVGEAIVTERCYHAAL